MFNTDKFRIKLVKRQTLAIILILIAGGTSSVYATTILDTTSVFQNITVLGTCTGCGGGEGTFTNYNTVALNTTVASSATPRISLIGNDGGILVSSSSKNYYVGLNGTTLFLNFGTSSGAQNNDIAQSETGKYKVLLDESGSGAVKVYNQGQFIQNLGINLAQFTTGAFTGKETVAISPDGKYISVIGIDTGGANNQVLIFQGGP